MIGQRVPGVFETLSAGGNCPQVSGKQKRSFSKQKKKKKAEDRHPFENSFAAREGKEGI